MADGILIQRGKSNTITFNNYSVYKNGQLYSPCPIFITAGSKYKLNSSTETIASTNTLIWVSSPINGYIKYKKGVL